MLSATFAANKTDSVVVIGSSTTVPSDATTVQLNVAAKGTKGGVIAVYPAGNPAGGSGQSLAYAAGSVLASTTVEENAGQAGELTFANSGVASATVTASVTGYSTQVTAGDINGVGGTAGQALTNTGSGAAWGPAGVTNAHLYTAGVSRWTSTQRRDRRSSPSPESRT